MTLLLLIYVLGGVVSALVMFTIMLAAQGANPPYRATFVDLVVIPLFIAVLWPLILIYGIIAHPQEPK